MRIIENRNEGINMKYIKCFLYCGKFAVSLAICILCFNFSQIAVMAGPSVNLRYTLQHSYAHYVVTTGETVGTLQVLDEGDVVSGETKNVPLGTSGPTRIIYFVKPEEGYLLTGAGTTGAGNVSSVSELHDPAKFSRTEAHVPQDIITRMENEGYLLAWGYTRSSGSTGAVNDRVEGYRPPVDSTISNSAGSIEVGQTLTMNIVVRPRKPFRSSTDARNYDTSIPDGVTTVTIDGNKVLPVTGLTKINKNEYRGTVSYTITDEDAGTNTHTAVVNSKVDYTLELAINTGAYHGTPTRTTTRVDATPGTATFTLVSSPARRLSYDLGYNGAPILPDEIHNSGNAVNVIAGIPVRDGYEFAGWFYTDTGGNTIVLQPADTFAMPDRVPGTKLTAKWNPKITIDNNNGDAVTESVLEAGYALTLAQPVKEGYRFVGWIDSDGNTYGINETIILSGKRTTFRAMWRSLIEEIVPSVLNNGEADNVNVTNKNTEAVNDSKLTDIKDKTAKGAKNKETSATKNKASQNARSKTAQDTKGKNAGSKTAQGAKGKNAGNTKGKASSNDEGGSKAKVSNKDAIVIDGKTASEAKNKQTSGNESNTNRDTEHKFANDSKAKAAVNNKSTDTTDIDSMNIPEGATTILPGGKSATGTDLISPDKFLADEKTLPRTGGGMNTQIWYVLWGVSALVYGISVAIGKRKTNK